MTPPPAASGVGTTQTGERLSVDFLLDIINEMNTMKKYIKNPQEIAQIKTIISELESMLKYAHN